MLFVQKFCGHAAFRMKQQLDHIYSHGHSICACADNNQRLCVCSRSGSLRCDICLGSLSCLPRLCANLLLWSSFFHFSALPVVLSIGMIMMCQNSILAMLPCWMCQQTAQLLAAHDPRHQAAHDFVICNYRTMHGGVWQCLLRKMKQFRCILLQHKCLMLQNCKLQNWQ